MQAEALNDLRTVWNNLYWEDALCTADLILGFGCPDPNVAQRAAKLFLQGYAPRIVFSGGLGKGTEGRLAKSEAETYAEIAMEMGVPKECILLETHSRNTGENLVFTKELLKQNGLHPHTVLVVHQPNMGRRIRATLQKQWAEDGIDFRIAPGDRSLEAYLARLSAGGVGEREMVSNIGGDLERMETYAKLGYQTPCEMPPEAWRAFERLIDKGYDMYTQRKTTSKGTQKG